MMGEEERLAVGIEPERRQVGVTDALEDQVDVGTPAFHKVKVDEDEENVVVGSGEVSARRQCRSSGVG